MIVPLTLIKKFHGNLECGPAMAHTVPAIRIQREVLCHDKQRVVPDVYSGEPGVELFPDKVERGV